MTSPVRAAVAEGTPDPADALRRLDRIAEAAADAGVALDPILARGGEAVVLCRLACGRAPYLATLLARDPLRLSRVAADPYLRREKPAGVMARELSARVPIDADDRALASALRRYRADEMVRLGARELGLGSPVEVGAELAHLADVCLDAAIDHHTTALAERHGRPRYVDDDGTERDCELAVIGMGKLGGEELNFASDIDVIYLYSSDNGAAGALSLHEFMSKLCKSVTAALHEMTEDDCVFKVDLRLRPEGSRGAIANSLLSTERYYESWGRPWERQAWLKARACAGGRALGEEAIAMLEPFVYPRHTSARVVEEVRDLNRRIKSEIVRTGAIDAGFDVKNGEGGIREIEFFAQALQLIHASQRPTLRTRSTLGALDQLLFAGIITENERRTLARAYRYLRHIEHLLQLDTGRQTQRMPADRAGLDLLARRLGHSGHGELQAVLAAETAEVARLFASVGDDGGGAPGPVLALLGGDLPPEEERRILAELGLRDPDQALRALELARRRATAPFGRTAEGAGARVAPLLLADVVASPDPDQALAYTAELAHRRGSWTSLWRMMDEHPPLRRLVASVFGTSDYLSRQFIDHPELFDALLAAGRARPRVAADDLGVQALARMMETAAEDGEERWNALAALKNAQVLRIGLADVAGELSPEDVCRELTTVADVCLQQAYGIVRGALEERHGVAREESGAPAELAVLALGKLGGHEIGYASDLDVVFVYSGDGESDGERPLATVTYMTRLAQRLMTGLTSMHPSGRLYEVDTRLRPSGSKGLLVSSLSAWQRYHQESARLWERQALTRLRPVAGDRALGERAAAVATEFVYGAPPAGDVAGEMRAMRDKIERELATGDGDLKAGRGGLIDIEFAAQYLQLMLGPSQPSVRSPSTLEGLRAVPRVVPELVAPCALLADAYIYLRRIEHRIRIVHDASEQSLPTDPIELDKLARRLGLGDADALRAAYRRWTAEVRRAFDDVLSWTPC